MALADRTADRCIPRAQEGTRAPLLQRSVRTRRPRSLPCQTTGRIVDTHHIRRLGPDLLPRLPDRAADADAGRPQLLPVPSTLRPCVLRPGSERVPGPACAAPPAHLQRGANREAPSCRVEAASAIDVAASFRGISSGDRAAVHGLRRGELVRLVISDYDASERTLLVRASKFHKSRIVALSLSAADEMERYLRARRRFPHHADAPLLVSNHRGTRAYSGESFGMAMSRLFRVADVRAPDGRFPHVHDLRHTFAAHALLRWYRAGVDVQTEVAGARDHDGPRLRRIDGVLPRVSGTGRRGGQRTLRPALPQGVRGHGEGAMRARPSPLARALREFFADYLPTIRGVSPHTVCSYRDAFTLLLRFLAERARRSVVELDFNDLSPVHIIAFLHHLEEARGNGAVLTPPLPDRSRRSFARAGRW